jgi:ATP-dependent Clp protease adaptor protein ClpS
LNLLNLQKVIGLKMNIYGNTKIAEEVDLLDEVKEKAENNIVLYNDEVNTFDFVIESLIDVCKHDLLQAEQCTLIVHYNGKCAVKQGGFTELRPLCEALLDRGLSATIE